MRYELHSLMYDESPKKIAQKKLETASTTNSVCKLGCELPTLCREYLYDTAVGQSKLEPKSGV